MNDVVCDLDGVIYRGDTVIAGAGEALSRLLDHGGLVRFVTNNSMRTPEEVAEKILRVTGVEVDRDQVVTSAQASASMLTEADAPAMVVGGEGIHAALAEAGIEVASEVDGVRSLVVGLDRSLTYQRIAAAARVVREGARFIASNTDSTFPTESGLDPGAGAIVSAIETASGVSPEVAGKPHPPMRRLIRQAGIANAWVIGDRLDTDVAMALAEPGWRSILVTSGVTTAGDAGEGPDHVVADFASAVDLVLSAGDQGSGSHLEV